MSNIEEAFETIVIDKALFNALVHGGVNATVETDSGTQPSIRKAVNDKLAAILGENYLRSDASGTFNGGVLKFKAGSNSAADYPAVFENLSNTLSVGYGAYGMSNKAGVSQGSDYTMDIGDDLFINAGTILLNTANAAEALVIKDTGRAGALANPYLSFKDSNNLRMGKLGLLSGSNSDMYLRADIANLELGATAGDVRISPSNATRALFSLNQITFTAPLSIEGNTAAHAGNVSTLVEENPNEITIADNAVGTVFTPRNGGFMLVTCSGTTSSPLTERNIMVYCDSGTSTFMAKVDAGAAYNSQADVLTGSLTGTSGQDGNISLSARGNSIHIENRTGSTQTFQYRFL